MNILFTLGCGMLLSVFTSWITVRLAIKRFRTEKLFEKRLEAYVSAMKAMHDAHQCVEQWIRWEELPREIPDDRNEELRSSYRRSKDTLRTLAGMGELMFSAGASRVLSELVTLLDSPNMHGQAAGIYDERESLAAALKELPVLAKLDLNS